MECKICGCTETTPCIENGVPCHWVLRSPPLCSSCVIEVKNENKESWLVEKSCRFCNNLLAGSILTPLAWKKTCKWYRFDGVPQHRFRYFSWTGIYRPNKTVRAAAKHCPHWELYPRYAEVNTRERSKLLPER